MNDDSALQLFGRAQDEFDSLVASVKDDQWASPTPCTDWNVRALVNHIVGEQFWVEPMLEGRTIEEVGDRLDGDLLDNDPLGTWRLAAERSRKAFNSEGALDGHINSSMGPSPARQYLGEMTFDLIVHRWDLGEGIGMPQRFTDDELHLLEVTTEDMAGSREAMISAGVFAPPPPVEPNADRQTVVLASFGRKG